MARYRYIANLNHRKVYNNPGTESSGVWASWNAKRATDPHAQFLVKRFTRRPAEELYDLDRDPHELDNLVPAARASNETLVGVKRKLRAELFRWMKAQADPGTHRGIPSEFSS